MTPIKKITVREIEYTAYEVAKKFMEWDEPIPEFGSRFPHILETCLESPFQTFDKKNLYKGLIGKAAIMFYLLIKNHPFQNGNKRIAIMSLLLFLHRNGKWLKVSNKELYTFAKMVAASDPKEKNILIKNIQNFLQIFVINFPENK